ncbi:hypothetical protein GJ496_005207 [Pomphorhynchus laevis]|nr:hypothetical protein GJ496_005207 [Pomphorhynchus laevis]
MSTQLRTKVKSMLRNQSKHQLWKMFLDNLILILFPLKESMTILSREAIQVGQKSKTSVKKQNQALVMESVHEPSVINSFSITRSTDQKLSRLNATSVLNSPMHNIPDSSGSGSNSNAGCNSRVFIQNHTSSYVERSCEQPASSDLESMPKPESFVDHSENQRSFTPQITFPTQH